jgi:hypothetical protein
MILLRDKSTVKEYIQKSVMKKNKTGDEIQSVKEQKAKS